MGSMSGSVVNLVSSPPSEPVAPAAAAGGPSAAAAGISRTVSNAPTHELSLVPIDSTFPRDRLHKAARIDGPPTIKLAREGRKLTLGRNMTCKIEAAYLSRQLISIHLQKRQGPTAGGQQQEQQQQPPRIILTMLKGKSAEMSEVAQHRVQLNGQVLDLDEGETRELKPVDVIALCEDQFRYVVHMGKPEIIELLDDDGDDEEDCKKEGNQVKEETAGVAAAAPVMSESDAAPSKPSSTGTSVPAQARKEKARDFECTICLEILIKARTLSCGHVICSNCATESGFVKVGAAAPQHQNHSESSSSEEVFHTAKEHHSESSHSSQHKSPKCPFFCEALPCVVPCFPLDNIIWNHVIEGTHFTKLADIKTYLSKVDRKLSEAQARYVFRNDQASLSEYLATLAPTREDERPEKKARSESSIDVAEMPDSKPSAPAAPTNDAENDNAGECVDLCESQADVICID